jgi:hypothetical protein
MIHLVIITKPEVKYRILASVILLFFFACPFGSCMFLRYVAIKRFSIYPILAVPGHALLWLSLVKWKRKKRECARF